MRKIAGLFVLLALLALAACGGTEDTPSPVVTSPAVSPSPTETPTPTDVLTTTPTATIEPTPTQTPEPSPTQQPTPTPQRTAAAEAYLGVVNDLIDQYGKPVLIEEDYGMSLAGVGFVRLIDFDRDGAFELYIAYESNDNGFCDRQVAYAYRNGKLVNILPECRVSNRGNDVSPWTVLVFKKDVVYLVDTLEGAYDYRRLKGDVFESVMTYDEGWFDEDVLLNGEVVTWDKVKQAVEEIEQGGEKTQDAFFGEATQKMLDRTNAVIALLESGKTS